MASIRLEKFTDKLKHHLSITGVLLFCLLVLPGLNPLEFIHNFLAPKAAYAECQEFPVTPIASHDPNDKLISVGVGTMGHILSGEIIEYTIRFENDKAAVASAQLVTITDPLGMDLDWSTFELGNMEFSNHPVEVPKGLTYYSTLIDLRPEGNYLLVEIEADFDPATGIAAWTFSAIDPETGEFTEDPLAGFLPPNRENHEGEGFVKFKIKPKSNLPSGTIIENVATIVFDWNPPIDTPRVFNTIDAGVPTSKVASISAQSLEQFEVSWTGQDDADGSGIASYDIYVSENNGPYKSWLRGTTATSGMFTGKGGNTYTFYSVAKDKVGNREQAPSEPDAGTITLITYPPSPPSVNFPADMERITTITPTLSIYNSYDEDGDQLTYEFEIYPNLDLTPPAIISTSQMPEGETTTSWTCGVISTGNGWYSWRARAFDGIAYSSWMEGGTFLIVQEVPCELHLSKSWNLISLPVEPSDRRVKVLFPDAKAVFGYSGQNAQYTPLDPNSTLEIGEGYWIYLPQEETYSLTGLPIERIEIPEAKAGWSMIGACTESSTPSVDKGTVRAMFGFSNKYNFLGPGDSLQPGKGYWINLSEEATLTVK